MKKNTFWIVLAAVVLVAVILIGTWIWLSKNRSSAPSLEGDDWLQKNQVITDTTPNTFDDSTQETLQNYLDDFLTEDDLEFFYGDTESYWFTGELFE